MSISRKITEGAGSGSGGGSGGYVDDVFSTYLWKGNGGDRDIVNGVDLDGEGGMVWIKSREDTSGGATAHLLQDTERGVTKWLSSDSSNQQATATNLITAFNSNGFSLGGGSYWANENQVDYTSWTFRKAPSFFDVVTWTGDSVQGREIPHNLGVAPGMIIVKHVTLGDNWNVYHKDLSDPLTKRLILNTSDGEQVQSVPPFNEFPVAPTDTVFTIGEGSAVNWDGGANGPQEYVAYVFAHDDSDEGMIQCGSYTGTGAAGNEIDLGWEPQYLLVKSTTTSGDSWIVMDTMRGIVTGENGPYLWPNTSSEEYTANMNFDVTPTGFKVNTTHESHNGSGEEYIYMAIRRPNKPASEFEPEELFAIKEGDGSSYPGYVSGFPVDAVLNTQASGGSHLMISRMTSQQLLVTSSTAAEAFNDKYTFDYSDGWFAWTSAATGFANMWRRAPGFFDVVAYEGDGQAGRELAHNLGVAPEMIWSKCRDFASGWGVWHTGTGNANESITNLSLNDARSAQFFNHPQIANEETYQPQSVYGNEHQNFAGQSYIAYLFASVPGICDIGTYTGNNGIKTIDCGFTNGARFVLIKRTDAAGDWMYFDTLRGIGEAFGSPLLKLNTADAQESGKNHVTPSSKGFKVTSTTTTTIGGAEYIYMAIA